MAVCVDVARSHAVVDQNQIDITWERAQEQAMQALQGRNSALAMTNWAKALEIAERHFERGDPRLAASLNNQGFSLLCQGRVREAEPYFREAVAAWEESWRWIPWMTPSSQADGAEPEVFDEITQEAFYGLIQKGKAITEIMWQEGTLPDVTGDDWPSVKPKGMNDVRRLFSAVFLMPTTRIRL